MKLEQFREEIKYRNIYNFVMDTSNDYFFGIDMEYIGEGASRRVYRYKDMAIKIAKSRFGLLQNEAEIEIFNECKDNELINIICPILWHDSEFKVVISKYAQPYCATKYQREGHRDITDIFKVYDEQKLPFYPLLRTFRKTFGMNHGTPYQDTLKESAWGSLDGRPVLVDYGYNEGVENQNSFHTQMVSKKYEFSKLTENQLCQELERRVSSNFKTKKKMKTEETKKRKEFLEELIKPMIAEPMGIQGFQRFMLDIAEMHLSQPKFFGQGVFKVNNAL